MTQSYFLERYMDTRKYFCKVIEKLDFVYYVTMFVIVIYGVIN